MNISRITKRVQAVTKNHPDTAINQGGLGYFTGWKNRKIRTNIVKDAEPTPVPPPPRDELFITFEAPDYVVEPISQSENSFIQGGWSGGAQTYFTNDTTDGETIVDISFAYQGTRAWFTGNTQLYGSPGQGSPFTPALTIETSAADETAFNEAIKGKTFCYVFHVYADSADGTNDGSLLKIYNGSYVGDDRTGFNINITKNATLDVTTIIFSGGSFIAIPLGSLAYDTWHKFEVFITYAADGEPENDVFKYVINEGTPQYVLSWPNVWRKFYGYTKVYGTRLAFATGVNPPDPPQSGWYIDNLELIDPDAPVTVPTGYILPTGTTVTPSPATITTDGVVTPNI